MWTLCRRKGAATDGGARKDGAAFGNSRRRGSGDGPRHLNEGGQDGSSRAAGLGVHTVTNIENQAANVRLDTVNRLAIALDVDPCLPLSSDPVEAPGDYAERPLGDSVAQNLKRLRLRLSLTQEQAATSAGLGRVYAYKIESKTVAATLDTLDALARVVGVETWQLLV